MLIAALFLALQAGEEAPAAHPLDLFMLDVTEACLLPDLGKSDPTSYFAAHGWVRESQVGTFTKQITGRNYSVKVVWPASKTSSASCSFETYDATASDTYEWFRRRIGEPQAITWSERQVGGWKMVTNGHDAGVYVSRKSDSGDQRAGMMLHILQR